MTEIEDKLKNIVKKVPHSPGVYQFLDKKDKILYIGKAKDLSNRVKSYFNKSPKATKTIKMISQTVDIKYIEVDTELEAYFLETNMIKEHMPKYNILMKDSKNFVYVKITMWEDFPQVEIVRKVESDGSKYFGPKSARHNVEKTLRVLRKLYPFKSKTLGRNIVFELRGDKELTRDEYRAMIDNIIVFLNGDTSKVSDELKSRMNKAAADKKYELAGQYRDKLFAIEDIMEKQKVSSPDITYQDYITFARAKETAFFNVFLVRQGKIIDNINLTVKIDEEHSDEEILEAFISQFYVSTADYPKEILVEFMPPNLDIMEDFIEQKAKFKVKLSIPQMGKKKHLIALSRKNANSFASQQQAKWESNERMTKGATEELRKVLSLESPPKRIECYDISHLAGEHTVGSMAVFVNGKARSADYRHFKLKTVKNKIDDFASLKEVLERRLKYLVLMKTPENIKIKKASKKHTDLIHSTIQHSCPAFLESEAERTDIEDPVIDPEAQTRREKECNEVNIKNFYILEEDKELKGYLEFNKIKSGPTFINKIQIEKGSVGKKYDERLIKYFLKKLTDKKAYILCNQDEVDHYTDMYFKEIKKTPKQLGKFRKGRVVLAYYKDTAEKIDPSFTKQPDLLVIDGGKGQLSTVVKVLNKYKLQIPIVSLAKKIEEIFTPGVKESIKLPDNSNARNLLVRIRDEAHRFAIEHNRGARMKTMKKSFLDTIPGLGDKSRTELIKHFGSSDGIKKANFSELTDVVGKSLAKEIQKHL